MRLTKPLAKCSNGCDAPPEPPSWVLCKPCLKNLWLKMQKIYDEWPKPAPAPKGGQGR